jgi:2-polyprenyl-3-methyl-5-hydroxy-6-metoxy-1,4-benzoquinol methylase
MSLRGDYDLWHGRNQNLDPEHDDGSSPWYLWVKESLPDMRGLRVLEVACGRGGFLKYLVAQGAMACGIDFSFKAIQVAKGKAEGGNAHSPAWLAQGDAHALPFPDNYFDILVSCETIEHLPSPLKAVREFHRVTRPGGTLFLTTPNYLNLMGLYEIYAKFRHPGKKRDQPFDRIQIFLQTRKLLTDAGWIIRGSDGTVHQLPIFPGRNPVRILGLEANRHIRKLLSIIAYHYCLSAEKKGK